MIPTIYNMVGSDGSWFSPYGWRARALLLYKQAPVEWVELRVADLKTSLAFANATTTPVFVDRLSDGELLLKDTWSIAQHLEARYPNAIALPEQARPGIELFQRLVDDTWQIPGFAAFSPNYFSNGVISGADEPIFRNIVERATGRSVESNLAIQDSLIADFRARLQPLEAQLAEHTWLLGVFSYADILLLSCLKCFAVVLRGIDAVLGQSDDFPSLRRWYAQMHETCHIDEPY